MQMPHLKTFMVRMALWCAVVLLLSASNIPHHHHSGMPCVTDDAAFEKFLWGSNNAPHAAHENPTSRQGCEAHSLYIAGRGIQMGTKQQTAHKHTPAAPFYAALTSAVPTQKYKQKCRRPLRTALLPLRPDRAARGLRAPPSVVG